MEPLVAHRCGPVDDFDWIRLDVSCRRPFKVVSFDISRQQRQKMGNIIKMFRKRKIPIFVFFSFFFFGIYFFKIYFLGLSFLAEIWNIPEPSAVIRNDHVSPEKSSAASNLEWDAAERSDLNHNPAGAIDGIEISLDCHPSLKPGSKIPTSTSPPPKEPISSQQLLNNR